MLNDKFIDNLYIIVLDKDEKSFLKSIDQVSGANPETGKFEQFMSIQKVSSLPEAHIFFNARDAIETLRKVRLSGIEGAFLGHFTRIFHSDGSTGLATENEFYNLTVEAEI